MQDSRVAEESVSQASSSLLPSPATNAHLGNEVGVFLREDGTELSNGTFSTPL